MKYNAKQKNYCHITSKMAINKCIKNMEKKLMLKIVSVVISMT